MPPTPTSTSRSATLLLGPPPSQILFSDCQHLTPAMFAPRNRNHNRNRNPNFHHPNFNFKPASPSPSPSNPDLPLLFSPSPSPSLRLYRGRCRRCDLHLTSRLAAAKQATLHTSLEKLNEQIRELEATGTSTSTSTSPTSPPTTTTTTTTAAGEREGGEGGVLGNAASFGKLEALRWRQERWRLETERRVEAVWRRFEDKWGRRDGRDLMYGVGTVLMGE